jgi:hypothetical protein
LRLRIDFRDLDSFSWRFDDADLSVLVLKICGKRFTGRLHAAFKDNEYMNELMHKLPVFGAALFDEIMEREHPSKRGKAAFKCPKKEKRKKEIQQPSEPLVNYYTLDREWDPGLVWGEAGGVGPASNTQVLEHPRGKPAPAGMRGQACIGLWSGKR